MPDKDVLGMFLIASACLLVPAKSDARDHGQYANSSPELREWFNGLKSGKGPCCSDADGTAVSDVDWDTLDNHYRVRINGTWMDVPEDAVLPGPNKAGRAMVWPITGFDGHLQIRCFIPGEMG